MSIIFAFVCSKKFYRFFESSALEVVSHELKETPNMDRVFRSFIPPCLSTEEENEEEQLLNAERGNVKQYDNALSQVSKIGANV